jgi:SAM-dependent methyltransferase
MTEEIQYGNWIRKKVLWILGLSSLGLGVLSILPFPIAIRLTLGACCLISLISFLFPLYFYWAFSHTGGNLQERVFDLIIEKLGEDVKGKALDIGTGNGILAIKLAKKFPELQILGLDYWGKNWEYSQSICENNARLSGVAERVQFHKGDAARLEPPENSVDAVVSNLTFHEVKSTRQKRELIREALRPLKPGGRFAFVDYFFEKKHYGETSELAVSLEDLKLSKMEFKPLSEVMRLEKILLHPKALGKVGIIYGVK